MSAAEQTFRAENTCGGFDFSTGWGDPVPPRPEMPPLELPRIPALLDLMAREQWIVWQYVWDDRRKTWTKPPHSPRTGHKCSATDQAHWTTFEAACDFCRTHPGYGVGFALSPTDDLTGIDLDKCISPETGALAPWAESVLALKETYAERSPSGAGIRLFARGKIDRTLKYDRAGVEIYGEGRYLTVTGRHISGAPVDISEAPGTLAALQERIASFKGKEDPKPQAESTAHRQEKAGEAAGDGFFRNVNDAAMRKFAAWVPNLFPNAYESRNGWRVASVDLDRNLEEDLSIQPEGIVDWGVADQGDPQEGKRTPIDLVIEWKRGSLRFPLSAREAAFWLCEQLKTDPSALGWTDGEAEAKAAAEAADADTAYDPWAKYPVPTFPLDCLPDGVARFVQATSLQTGGCVSAVSFAALVAISGGIDHGWRLRMHRHSPWRVSPRLWGLLVGEPSTKKTPIVNAVLSPLERREERSRRAYADAVRQWKDCGGDDASEPQPPTRFVATDVTVEKLGEVLAGQTRGIMIKRDELTGWFASMERYGGTGAGSADRPFWLEAYNGGSYSIDRIKRGSIFIENLSCSIIGGLQPERLQELHGLTSDGLLQRFVPVMVGPPRFPEDRPFPNVAEEWGALFDALIATRPALRHDLVFDDEALLAAEAFRRELHDIEQAVGGLAAGFQAFAGKLPGTFGSLCLVLHLARDPITQHTRPVGTETVEAAARIVREFVIPHAMEFYRTAETKTVGDRLQRIASYILTSGKDRFVPSDFTRNVALLAGMSVPDLFAAVSPLVAGGWLVPNDPRYPKEWRLTAGVRARFAERAREEERRKEQLAAAMKSPRRASGGQK